MTQDATSGQLRGSVLLLVGRAVALCATLATQVLLVRLLSREDFGRLSYGLAAVVVLQSLLGLGLDRADTRFLATYEVAGDHARLAGTFAVEGLVVLASGLVAVTLSLVARSGHLGSLSHGDSAQVLAILLLLVPLQLLDVFVVNALAVFARPRDVFFRRYALEPGLRLAVTVTVAAAGGGLVALGWGYVAATGAGTFVYAGMLARVLRRRRLVRDIDRHSVRLPWRPLLAFSAPLLLANLTAVAGLEVAVLVLGHYRAADEVGAFRAVQPFAALGVMVLFTFGTLFTPAAARLQARGDLAELRHLHWRTTAWIALLSWPVFALTALFADPLTRLVLGGRYASSAPLLTLLAVAAYVNAACGPNGTTVQILGRVRWMLGVNALALTALVVATLVLVPRYGARGAAVAVLVTTVVHNLAKQAGLGPDVGTFSAEYAPTYVRLGAATAACWVAQQVGPSSPLYAATVVAVFTLGLLRWCARDLEVTTTFPELARVAVARRLLGT